MSLKPTDLYSVQLKSVHLLRRLERINRDLEELENLQNTIRDDREYAGRLKNSLIDEFMRLESLKGKIFAQVIKSPPDELIEKLGGAPRQEERPEITGSKTKPSSAGEISAERAPGKNSGSISEAPPKPVPEAEKGEKRAQGKTPQKPGSEESKKGAPYKFVYSRPDKTSN